MAYQKILDSMSESLSMFHDLLKEPGMEPVRRFYKREHTPGERVSVIGFLLYKTYGDGSVYRTNDWERMMRR